MMNILPPAPAATQETRDNKAREEKKKINKHEMTEEKQVKNGITNLETVRKSGTYKSSPLIATQNRGTGRRKKSKQ